MTQTALYNPECETLPREELEQLQIERLQSTLNRVYRNVAFYRTAFDTHCVNLEKIKDVRSLGDLPFTTKEDLQKSYPYDMFAVPLPGHRADPRQGRNGRQIHRGGLHAKRPAKLDGVHGETAGGRGHLPKHDVVQIALDYSLLAGGFGFHQGAEQIGASVIPMSLTTGMEKQIAIMKDFKTTALISTPSHAANTATRLEEMQVHPERLSLRLGVFGGERWSEEFREQLQNRLHITAIDMYGLTEIMGPGVAGECHARQGLHINEDHFIVEVIDPKTLRPVGTGEPGELVFTTITKEGFPLIRYRTGDITSIDVEPCSCGRTLARMARITGRTDDLILFHGVGFFPAQIEEILNDVAGASPHFRMILDRASGTDTMEIKVEISEQIPAMDEVKKLETLRSRLAARIRTVLDVEARISFVEPRSLRNGTEGEARVLDRRPG